MNIFLKHKDLFHKKEVYFLNQDEDTKLLYYIDFVCKGSEIG